MKIFFFVRLHCQVYGYYLNARKGRPLGEQPHCHMKMFIAVVVGLLKHDQFVHDSTFPLRRPPARGHRNWIVQSAPHEFRDCSRLRDFTSRKLVAANVAAKTRDIATK